MQASPRKGTIEASYTPKSRGSADSSPFGFEEDTRSTVSGSFSGRQWSMFSSTELIRMEGYLQKKQNKWPNLYNKRYFKLAPNGERLLYFNEEPVRGDSDQKEGERPSAAIDLKKVKEIVKKGNKQKQEEIQLTRLELLYENRNFTLKAKSEEERDRWVECLQSAKRLCELRGASVKSNLHLKKQPSIRREGLSRQQSNQESRKPDYKFENLPNSVVAQILEESPEMMSQSQEHQRDQKFLINKGVLRYAGKVDKEKLNARMIYGSLDKRSKGNVKYWMKRWLLLVSSRPLKEDLYVEDDFILEETNFPVWLEFDVIYYFKEESDDDDSPNIGEIPLSKVVRVEDKDMSQSRDKGHTFIIDTGTKKYHFNTKHKYEMDRWLEAIEMSSRTVQERQMSITGQNKNISKIIQQFDEDEITFEGKLTKDVAAHFSAEKNSEQFDDVIENCTDLADSLVAIFDACLAQKPPRHDILQMYMETQHSKMISFLGEYWEKNAVGLSPFQVLNLMEWTQNYTEKLQKFGIQDDEVRNGNLALCNAYTSKISERIIPTIAKILEYEREEAPQVNHQNGKELLFTNAANDIFKLFSESFEIARAKGFRDLIKQIIKLLKELIEQYQEALGTIIEVSMID